MEDVSLLMGFTYHTPAIISVSYESNIKYQYYTCSHKKDPYRVSHALVTSILYFNVNLLHKPKVHVQIKPFSSDSCA